MEKPSACFEITSGAIKLLIGYELDGQPVVLYTKSLPNPYMNDNGTIADVEGLISTLSQLREIEDANDKMRFSLKEAKLLLPSAGLYVFLNQKTTLVVSQSGKIEKIDVMNVLSQMNKEEPPSGYGIVDIIPEAFLMDGDRVSENPPLGETSNSLSIKGWVHCLPNSYLHSYRSAMERAGFRIKSMGVSAYCQAELYKGNQLLPPTYILVDIGDRLTTVSLVGNHSPYRGINFSRGGRQLSEKIASDLQLEFEAAEKLKLECGYDERRLSYNPPISQSSQGKPIFQQDLNQAIADYFSDYFPHLESAISELGKNLKGDLENLPILLSGGSSLLNGIEKIWGDHFPQHPIKAVCPNSIGARDPGYSGLLGLLLTSSSVYKGSLDETMRGVSALSRDEEEKQAKKKKPLFGKKKDEDEDVL